ncbi:MAG: metal ABC transporter ATP-binding protein [Bacteroides sp.]
MTPLIEIKDLTAGYDQQQVLHHISLSIFPNDFLGIVGPNGGGKTTLLKCILGLLKPQEGEIRFRTSREHTEGKEKLRLGYLPQYSHIDKKFPITVWDTILSGLLAETPILSRWSSEEQERAREVITRMGLEGLEQRPIGALSGGELQRVLLGRAVVSNPEVLVLDEPGTYIDKRTEARLYELLDELNEQCAIVMVSHDTDSLLRHARSLAVVDRELTYYPATKSGEFSIIPNLS